MKQKIMNSTILTNETGRSMVEMLGVLAIIGVLSVGGVYGYGVAMKKHKANELLHQASMLATTVSAQIMSGKNPTTLDSFANSDLGTFTLETYTDGDNTFKLKISDIDADVCEQMKSSMGGMVRDIVCDENAKTALMTFNKDLSTTDLPKTESVIDKNITNPEDCQKAGKTWCVETSSGNGQCSNSTDCCRGVSAPTCKDCTVVEGGYAFTSALPWAECDSDGDGTNDGQCIVDVDEDTAVYTCQQVSCQETESCCKLYDVDKLDQLFALMEPLGMSLETVVGHLHKVQCSICDPENGQTEPFPDGVGCQFFDLGTMSDTDGNCVNGSCVAFDPDAFYKSCTSYTNCDSGEYCQFFEETIPTDPKPEKGYCLPLSSWKVESSFQKFTSYVPQGVANPDWWTALDVCSAMGKRLATWEEFGCDVNKTYCVGLAETWYQTDGTMVVSYVYKSASNQSGGFFVQNGDSSYLYDHAYIPGERGDKVPSLMCADK